VAGRPQAQSKKTNFHYYSDPPRLSIIFTMISREITHFRYDDNSIKTTMSNWMVTGKR
jgi:hypothetical protein